MYPLLNFIINNTEISLSPDKIICPIAGLVLYFFLKKNIKAIPFWKAILLVLIPSVVAFFGGSLLYHWVIEHKLSLEDSGQAYYGALFFQSLTFWLLTQVLLKSFNEQVQAMDVFSMASPFLYGLMRINCFMNGCCYGKLCKYPWSVIFKDENALTPLLGLPIHPTQIYSAVHGILAGLVLYWIYQKRESFNLKGQLYWVFLILMGVGRLMIEPLRADLKSSLWYGYPANQWMSIGIIFLGASMMIRRKYSSGADSLFSFRLQFSSLRASLWMISIVSVSMFLTGCTKIPDTPEKKIVNQTDTLGRGIFVHQMSKKEKSRSSEKRNLLFVAVDDAPEDVKIINPALSKLYRTETPPRFEEVLWWHYSKKFSQLYNRVVRIQYDSFDWASLLKGIGYLEDLHESYDMILLVHGIPNHLVSSKKHTPIKWENFKILKGEYQLQYLNLVFLQACFGDTLSEDFREIGARSVISFHEFHDNVLFFDYFIKKYIKENGDVDAAFDKASTTLKKKVEHSFTYKYILKHLLEVSPDEYLDGLTMPTLDKNSVKSK